MVVTIIMMIVIMIITCVLPIIRIMIIRIDALTCAGARSDPSELLRVSRRLSLALVIRHFILRDLDR